MTRIALADDHSIFREGLAQLFGADPKVELVGQAEDGDQLLELLASNDVDVAIVDVSMPGPGIQRICEELVQRHLPTKVVVLTMHEDARRASQLIAAGASGYVLKRNAFTELQEALAAIVRGETFVSQLLTADMARIVMGNTPSMKLTPRELEVVKLVAQGDTNARIARRLEISVKTVQTHRARAMDKLNVHSAVELTRCLGELGLL